MPSDHIMRIHSAEFQAMAARVLRVTELTSRLNVLPFEDEAGKAELFAQILGRPLPARVTIITSGHPVDPEERRLYLTGAPIDVAENVWIGAGATILPGVSIGRDAVVAAGAVVADDVPPATLVSGAKATTRRQW
ncbi:transferase hexapeptide (six repeat-containing protein) [Micromonospora haikouensis]|uniref:Transferase hexapeptide (Six repeat-containing protein) n=1 Tax=Micromonospora haikouensis TaxID=686309 RepID=A0A1C4X3C1_9ACTN|nr:DapH/DapD/GlmU-related protein [Micromonospora haikouensis]SCF02937.1 transferase hexapeptide (six repeat-containing protein) [Micromonospora haikouensis]